MTARQLILTRALPSISRRMLIKTALAAPALPIIASCDTVREYTQKVIAFLTAFNSLIGGGSPSAGTPIAQIGLQNNRVPLTNGTFGTYLFAEKIPGEIDMAVREHAARGYAGNLTATREKFFNNNKIALIDYHETNSGEIKQYNTREYETILNINLRHGKYVLAYDTAEGFFVRPFASDGIAPPNTIYIA